MEKLLLIIAIIYCLIGLVVLVVDNKRIKESCVIYPNQTPFYNGFMLGLFQASIIIMYPFHLYFSHKNESQSR